MINLTTKKQGRRRMQIALAQAEGFENSAPWQMVLGTLWRNVGDWKFRNLWTVQLKDLKRLRLLPSSPIQGFFEKLQTITVNQITLQTCTRDTLVSLATDVQSLMSYWHGLKFPRKKISSVGTISHQVFAIGSSFSCWLFPMFSSIPMTRCQDHRVPFQHNLQCTKIWRKIWQKKSQGWQRTRIIRPFD